MMIELPSNIWHGNEPLYIDLPETWDTSILRMKGDDKPAITREQIAAAIRNPINAKSIEKLAEEREDAVIIFDDMTRPTKVEKIAEPVLNELERAKIRNEDIVFVCANGAHGTYDMEDFEKKLGRNIVENYAVFNHNPYDNLVYLGHTTAGTPVEINSEVMSYSLKIGIGCILPHPQYGYSGGAKIILPGVSGIRSIVYNHGVVGGWSQAMQIRELHPTCQMAFGRVNEENALRRDAEEAAAMCGLDFLINVLVNTRQDSTDIFAGNFIEAQRKGVEIAREHYSTPVSFDFDVVISNAYSKASEAAIATWPVICLKNGGTLVITCNSRTGQVTHYVHGRWGIKRRGGFLYLPPPDTLKKASQVIFLSKYHEKQPWLEMLDEKAVRVKNWEEVVEIVGKREKKVAVFPDATIQKPF
jgi:nickel-dependent lactate racemase